MILSVLVPIYRAEKYLRDCLNSLKRQVLDRGDIEFILIDDGSPDCSGKIADEYAKSDKRFKVFHKPNGGVISAWKLGLDHANGEFIGFVDSDDYVEDAMYNKLVNCAVENNADIVCCNYYSDEEGIDKVIKLPAKSGVYDKEKIAKELLPFAIDNGAVDGYQRCVGAVRWNKIFAKELLLKNIKYFDDTVSYGDDLLVVYSSLAAAKAVAVINEALYHFRYNPLSITHSYNRNLTAQVDRCDEILFQITKDYNLKCYDQIYRNAAQTVFRVISNELKNHEINNHQRKKVIKNIICTKKVQIGARLIPLKEANLKQRIKFFLLKHKQVGLLMQFYKRH